LKKGTFKEQGDKPYCHGCFERLFGWKTKQFRKGMKQQQTIMILKNDSFFFFF
jgi:hypothetical protein